jgi:serine/threonine-protein kinase
MAEAVRCPNPNCGRSSHLGDDRLGRTFRCPHCRTKLAKAAPSPAVGLAAPLGRPIVRADWGVGPPPPSGPSRIESRARASEAVLVPAEEPPRLGRFRIVGTLGEGASATVYRAFDPRLRRDVALKVLRDEAPGGPRAAARFLAEARAMARLGHPRIVAIHEVGRDGGRYYIASALIEGPSLARALDDGPLDPRAAARIAADLAEALAFAHARGVVHRDVKPGNILLDPEGAAYLSDFGLAHRSDSARRLTVDGAVLGTPAYVAPEQAGAAAGPLPASDQYGVGAVLYEMICGRPPFVGPPLLALFRAVHEAPPPPRSLRPGVPVELEAICLRALAKRPGGRYPDCQAMADALREWLASETQVHGSAGRRHRRRAGAAVAALAASFLVAAAIFAAVRSLATPPASPPPAQADSNQAGP